MGSFIASGEADTYGFEAFVAGSPHPGLDLTVGYSYVETDLVTDPTPPHSFTAWGRYTVQSGPLDGLFFGLGARAVSDFDAESGDVTINAPGYAVFDAMVGYHITDNVRAQVFVENVFDRDYVDRINQTSRGTFFGEPLNATFRVSATF